MKPPFFDEAADLLQRLISIPSLSREEAGAADELTAFLLHQGAACQRLGNNVWAKSEFWRPDAPVVLLNSHLDTVKPAAGWLSDPFEPLLDKGRLTGLGANDAGASLVCLAAAFLALRQAADLPFNLLFAASAEEEISGQGGFELLLPRLGRIDMGIVGEPTGMRMAVAEKGLLVLDVLVQGVSGHAARNEGDNAIYRALPVIEWFRQFRYPQVSEWLGEVKMTVTQIESGTQHNVVPDRCHLVVDVRPTEVCTLEELVEWTRSQTGAVVTPRSLRLRPSCIDLTHPLPRAGAALGIPAFGSPTLSDQALMPFPTIKMGPGDSARSHTAGEFILLSEVADGITGYVNLLQQLGRELAG